MSNYVVRASIALGGVLAVAGSVQYVKKVATKEREIASVERKKDTLLKPESTTATPHTEKVTGPVLVRIAVKGEEPKEIGTPFVLEALVQASKSIENLHFEWHLPEGIVLINGDRKNTIAVLDVDHPYLTQVTVVQSSVGNKQIHFTANAVQSGVGFGVSTQYNSVEQANLDSQKAFVKAADESRTLH
jgi:hypothetical protein